MTHEATTARNPLLDTTWHSMGPPTSVARLTPYMTNQVEHAMREHAQGETVTWDLAFQLVPDAQGALLGAVAVYAQIPGVLPKSYIGAGIFLQPMADDAVVDQEVRVLLESLREGRSKQLDSMQQAGTQAARTGRPSPASGLILP